jgi:hypothetical protein
MRFLRLFLAALGLALLPSTAAVAQSGCHRCLGGFRFMPSSIVNDPFASTQFENSTGGGMALDLNVPVRNLAGDTTGTLSGNIGFLLVDFDYQKQIARWLALRGSLAGVGRIGTSVEALVASGVSAAFGASAGATVPIWSTPKFLVSATGDFGHNTVYDVDPYGFAKEVVDSGYNTDSKAVLLNNNDINQWTLALRGAWGIAPWVGLNAQLGVGQVDRPSVGYKSVNTFGAQVGFDFAKLSNVPVGLSLAYRGLTGPAKTGDITKGYRITEFGVFYTGRSEFMIGADFFWSTIAVKDSSIPDVNAAQFRIVTHIDF